MNFCPAKDTLVQAFVGCWKLLNFSRMCVYVYVYICMYEKNNTSTTVCTYSYISIYIHIYIYIYVCVCAKIHMMPLLALPSFELDQIFAENFQKRAGSHPCSWLVSIGFDLKNPAAPLISNLKPEQVQEPLQNKHVHHHIYI